MRQLDVQERGHYSIRYYCTCDEVVHQRSRDAEDAHQQVTDSQIEDEEVGDCPHVTVPHNNEAHQAITHHAQQEDEQVGQDEASSHREGVLVVREVGDVVGGGVVGVVNSSVVEEVVIGGGQGCHGV